MIVQGDDVPQAAIDAAERIISGVHFGFALVKHAVAIAWPEGTDSQHDRVADRLVRKAKRDGRVRFDGLMWRRVEARAGDTGVCPQCGERVTLVKRGLVGDHAGGWCTWRGVPVESTRTRHGF